MFIGDRLTDKEVKGILAIIRRNAYVFAWERGEMIGVDPA